MKTMMDDVLSVIAVETILSTTTWMMKRMPLSDFLKVDHPINVGTEDKATSF